MYPNGKKYGLFLYDSLVWIYFVVASQTKEVQRHEALGFFCFVWVGAMRTRVRAKRARGELCGFKRNAREMTASSRQANSRQESRKAIEAWFRILRWIKPSEREICFACEMCFAREEANFISHCDEIVAKQREQYFTIHKVNYFTFGNAEYFT